jgi:cysteine-rich repeat protein
MPLAPRLLALALFACAWLAPAASLAQQPTTYRGSRLIATEADGWCSEARGAGGGGMGLEGKKIVLKAASNPKNNEFTYWSGAKQEPLSVELDPRNGFEILVTGGNGPADRSALVQLDATRWRKVGVGKAPGPTGWKYSDPKGRQGGVREVLLRRGQIKIKARGEAWRFAPDAGGEEVTVHLKLGNQSYCSSFGGEVQRNDLEQFKARNAGIPAACPVAMCGNGVQDVGEQCDDGDLVADDGCGNDCLETSCQGEAYASTFEAIQAEVLDVYGCTSGLCHGQYDGLTGAPGDHESGLVLLPSSAANLPVATPQGLEAVLQQNHDALLGSTPANNAFYDHFAVAGDSKTSLVYQALYKKVYCGPEVAEPPTECEELDDTIAGEGMPEGVAGGIAPAELEAIDLWLRGGAPLDGVIAGTAERLDSCLPPATPQKIDPPPAPGAGAGVQLVSSAWPLPQQSENEICFPIYYDFTQTNLIPLDQQIDCPTDENGEDVFGPHNTGHKCFRWHKQFLLQDPQSHHSIIHIYTGVADTTDPSWGEWTKKPNDPTDPEAGQQCDPLDIDEDLGFNPNCSGEPERSAACLNYGPDDFGLGGLGGAGESPQFSGSQETHYEQELYDGVYSVLPMKGIVVFNSHAFNLTDVDTTMNQYLNLWLAQPGDQLHQTQQVFDASEIFWDPNPIPPNPSVPAFETREFCRTYTAPEGANLFWLSSHTHRHGVRWRTYGPPNTPCNTTNCPGPGPESQLLYYSTVYNDPIQLEIDPPLVLTGSAEDRTFLFCALYDNGSTPTSPSVKRHSLSPDPPLIFGIPVGGPCAEAEKTCVSTDPAKRGQPCGSEPDPDAFCTSPSTPGFCDACPLRGGFTTEDEMFILLGNFFVP